MLYVIKPFCSEFCREGRMDYILDKNMKGEDVSYILTAEQMAETDLSNKRIAFAVCLSESGMNLELHRMLDYIRRNSKCFSGAVGVVIIDGSGEFYTKNIARQLVLTANMSGCAFPGKSLVEATGDLYNFNIASKVLGVDNLEAYDVTVNRLIRKLKEYTNPVTEGKKILVVHASSRNTSNSLMAWEMVKEKIGDSAAISEVSLRNGEVMDCIGCKYEACLHFGERGECFYGGIIVEQAYPAIIDCDCIVMVCPNYNDAVSANITAFINRLTALFRSNDFSKKKVFAIVISGYSGGDIVAEQIIGAMNFNKNFILPSNFAIIETANDPGSILDVRDIDKKIMEMANKIMN